MKQFYNPRKNDLETSSYLNIHNTIYYRFKGLSFATNVCSLIHKKLQEEKKNKGQKGPVLFNARLSPLQHLNYSHYHQSQCPETTFSLQSYFIIQPNSKEMLLAQNEQPRLSSSQAPNYPFLPSPGCLRERVWGWEICVLATGYLIVSKMAFKNLLFPSWGF